jgi:membrane protein implicated in regulation of membrane protease activity
MIPALSIVLVIITTLALLSFAVAVLYSVLAIVRWLRGYLDERRIWRAQRRRCERLGLVVERRAAR